MNPFSLCVGSSDTACIFKNAAQYNTKYKVFTQHLLKDWLTQLLEGRLCSEQTDWDVWRSLFWREKNFVPLNNGRFAVMETGARSMTRPSIKPTTLSSDSDMIRFVTPVKDDFYNPATPSVNLGLRLPRQQLGFFVAGCCAPTTKRLCSLSLTRRWLSLRMFSAPLFRGCL